MACGVREQGDEDVGVRAARAGKFGIAPLQVRPNARPVWRIAWSEMAEDRKIGRAHV